RCPLRGRRRTAMRMSLVLRSLMVVVFLAALLVLGGDDAYGVTPKELVGTYDVTTKLSDGKEAHGTLEVTLEKLNTLKMTWTWKKINRIHIGLGRLKKNKLTVEFTRAKLNIQGKGEYTVQQDGSLVGSWEETNAKANVTATDKITKK